MTNETGGNQATVDVLEERLIDAEYKIWKKNTPYLYDFVLTHSLEWPSLTCEWLPKTPLQSPHGYTEHSLLLGTHTTGEQNYVMVASCALPQESLVENKTTAASYDEEKKEVGGFGHAHSAVGKIEIKLKVKHEGEVNRARYMPQNHFVIASRGPNPEVYIYDLSKHPSVPASADSAPAPQGVLCGHTKEGYSMVWSHHTAGHLCTGSEDATVKVWDVNSCLDGKTAQPGLQITKPLLDLKDGHSDTVEDVDWHAQEAHLIASVGDDCQVLLWDTRSPTKPMHAIAQAHSLDINCIALHPTQQYVFCTGSADKTVAIWDMRKLKDKVISLEGGHTDQVYKVEWAPHKQQVLGSCSSDRRVAIWDLSRIGKEQSPEDAQDGPPELLFLHGGHTAKVSDFCWNENGSEWTIASVSEDNVLQVWNMAEEIYMEDDDDDEEEDEGEPDDDEKKGGALKESDLE